MKKALYRKYRPTKLEDVVGQEKITTSLKEAISSKKISHSYIFIGSRGTGKTSVARIFAHAVNQFSYEVEDEYVDIIEIDAASNTGVDNIREIRERAFIAPALGKYKVYIIDEFHMLSKSAFNALLKILEEPPEYVIFIMATTEPDRIPATIFSRSQVFYFDLATPEIMKNHLKKISDAENFSIDDQSLDIIVKLGGGSFRDSITLLDQVSILSKGQITKELVLKSLGVPKDQTINDILTAYLSRDFNQITETLKSALNSNLKPESIAVELIRQILTNPTPDLLPLLSRLPEIQPPFAEAKLLVALYDTVGQNNLTHPINISSRNLPTSPIPASNPTNLAHPEVNVAKPSISIQNTPRAQESSIKPASHDPESPTANLNSKNSPVASPPSGEFSWEYLLEQIKPNSPGIYKILSSSSHELDSDSLRIYPVNKVNLNILKAQKNLSTITKFTGNLQVSILEKSTSDNVESSTAAKLSAIMGGKVQEVINGESPF